MDDLTAIHSEEKTLRCRSCREWLPPMYGSEKDQEPFHALSPRGIRMAIEKIADGKGHAYFECYDCEKKRRAKKAILWVLLGLIAGGALLFGEIQAGRLHVPW